MTEPIGWNVYYSGNGNGWTFREFVPNEPELAAEAEKLADEVEQFVAGTPDNPAT